jgi:hypothetical protein
VSGIPVESAVSTRHTLVTSVVVAALGVQNWE